MTVPVEPRQAEIDALHAEVFAERLAKERSQSSAPKPAAGVSLSDEELLAHARAAKNSDSFSALYDRGDKSRYATADNEGRSEADYALCAHLYFWCGPDPERIMRLWRSSALWRDKLNRGDYCTRTIEAVIARGGPTFSGGRMNGHTSTGGTGQQQQTDQRSNGPGICRASIQLSTVESERIEWVWDQTIPSKKATGFIGLPGTGKSSLVREIAARVTKGEPFPGGSHCQVGTVIFIDEENGIADTIRPGIDAQGGDPSKVVIFKLKRSPDNTPVHVDLGNHLPLLYEEIKAHPDTRLVIIDPPTSFLGDIDETKNGQVRSVLSPLKTLAEDTGVAVLLCMHFNKNETKSFLLRVTGSLAFVELPRITWALVQDPADASRRLMLLHKTNITAPDLPGYAFTITPTDDGHHRLKWCEDRPTISLEDLIPGAPNTKRSAQSSKVDDIINWLCEDVLKDGEEHLERDIRKAAEMRGFSKPTYRRAKEQLWDEGKGSLKFRAEGFGKDKKWWMRLAKPN